MCISIHIHIYTDRHTHTFEGNLTSLTSPAVNKLVTEQELVTQKNDAEQLNNVF